MDVFAALSLAASLVMGQPTYMGEYEETTVIRSFFDWCNGKCICNGAPCTKDDLTLKKIDGPPYGLGASLSVGVSASRPSYKWNCEPPRWIGEKAELCDLSAQP